MAREKSNYFHINYLRSSNAMDVIKEKKNGKTYLTYKVIGGIIDIRLVISNQNPKDLLKGLTSYIGQSNIPPFWAMGFHQCRWGY